MESQKLQKLLYLALEAALEAADSINAQYLPGIGVEIKSDGSPITEADRSAHEIIARHLETTGIPIISEESPIAPWEQRRQWEWLWLVDPLDGTKEFIGRNGEFTVNIALIHFDEPVLGVIVAPALNNAFLGWVGQKAWKIANTKSLDDLHKWKHEDINTFAKPIRLITAQEGLSVAVSRSHYEERTEALILRLKDLYQRVNLIAKGSSLKFCDLAENLTTIYPRFSPTNEWDTAAGHAILRAAGGEVFDMQEKKPIKYNKPKMQNPPIIAFSSKFDSNRYFSELSL